MKVKERESWVSNNVGKGGKRPSYDEFNKAFKGQERNPRAQEYASQGLEEYHHYSERAEYKENSDESKSKQKQEQKRSSTSNAIRNVIGRVVAVVAGAVILVTTYTTMTVVSSNNWIWSSDMQTVSVELVRRDGVVIKELPAVVTVTQQDPVCNQTGLKTFTATAEDEDEVVYSDVRYETLSPLGHDHYVVEETILDGQIIRVYECSRCHERFTITIDIDDND